MREVRLNNGVMMPSVGFGVYQIDKSETKTAVLEALEVGYRMIDTAASYFNEREVGEAIRESGMPRESVFVTSKLWVQDYEYDDALRAFDRSLSELGLDYIDLYLLHKPYGNYYAAWRALERLHKEGRIRAIGVTSFSNERLQDLFLHQRRQARGQSDRNASLPTAKGRQRFSESRRHRARSLGSFCPKARMGFSPIRYSLRLLLLTARASRLSFCAGSINEVSL